MDIGATIDSIGTTTELKRIASAYVIDYRNLSDAEIRAALKKTAPQYFHEENVRKALDSMILKAERKTRLLTRLILKEVLLNKDGFMCLKKETDDDIIAYEQGIINESNEEGIKTSLTQDSSLEIFSFVLETSWANNDSVSVDEKNLLSKLQTRLKITDRQCELLEATLGKFPQPGNLPHTRDDIETVRRALQSNGLLFCIRDNDGTDYDVLPSEIAGTLREILDIEIRHHGYVEMLNHKFVRSKPYLQDVLKKCEIVPDKYMTLETMKGLVMDHVRPSVLLGGISPRDGVDAADLKKWCGELKLQTSGVKSDLIDRLIEYYDAILAKDETISDDRELWYQYYEHFAKRDLLFLRKQQLISKDIECERKFEEATNYLFHKRLGHKPLTLVGTAHADGALSFQEKILLWDNKSKESQVNLKDHIRQFDGYIRDSEKSVAGFLVIGPEFTPESSQLAMKYHVESGTTIALIKADVLKQLAEAWGVRRQGGSEDPFPLGYLIQPGVINVELVTAALS